MTGTKATPGDPFRLYEYFIKHSTLALQGIVNMSSLPELQHPKKQWLLLSQQGLHRDWESLTLEEPIASGIFLVTGYSTDEPQTVACVSLALPGTLQYRIYKLQESNLQPTRPLPALDPHLCLKAGTRMCSGAALGMAHHQSAAPDVHYHH